MTYIIWSKRTYKKAVFAQKDIHCRIYSSVRRPWL